MPGILTRKMRQNVADLFKAQVDNGTNNIYLFIGHANSWPSELEPPTPLDTEVETQHNIWRQIVSLKKVVPASIAFTVPRVDWESGDHYARYTDNSLYQANSFYVLTEDFNVYKCLNNANNGSSTVKPSGTDSTALELSDGYQWRYLYTVSTADNNKFVTPHWMPVKSLATDDTTPQWDVQAAAANCSIETYIVAAGGSNYRGHVGTVAAGNTTSVTLGGSASATGGYYVGNAVYIYSGLGSGQVRTISNYNGTTKRATLSSSFSVAPNTSSTYIVAPKITVAGDGAGATAYAKVSGSGVINVHSIATGVSYSFASVTLAGNGGSGASIKPIISPWGGHGANAVIELAGHNVMVNVKLTGTESNTIIGTSQFRLIGLVKNPRFQANNKVATATAYNNATKLALTGVVGTFQTAEVLTGGTSGATGYVVEKISANTLHVSNVRKKFTAAETVTGGTSGATATVNVITLPTLKQASGEIMYLEQRTAISRSEDQEEDLRLNISF